VKRGLDVISDRKCLLHIDKIYTYITHLTTTPQSRNLLFQQKISQSKNIYTNLACQIFIIIFKQKI